MCHFQYFIVYPFISVRVTRISVLEQHVSRGDSDDACNEIVMTRKRILESPDG